MKTTDNKKLKQFILKLYGFSALCDHGYGPPRESSFCLVVMTAEDAEHGDVIVSAGVRRFADDRQFSETNRESASADG